MHNLNINSMSLSEDKILNYLVSILIKNQKKEKNKYLTLKKRSKI